MADNIGNFSSSVAGTAAVNASATGITSNGVHAIADSADASAVYGEHTGTGIGVFGRGGPTGGEGVFGQTNSGSSGVYGKNTNADRGGAGVTGEGTSGPGVSGFSTTNGIGVVGTSTNREGVVGESTMGEAGVLGIVSNGNASGVFGLNNGLGFGVKGSGGGGGVFGQSDSAANAVYGQSTGLGSGVVGESVGGSGVSGTSTNNVGVYGQTSSGFGAVYGEHTGQGIGVFGISTNGTGVHGKGGRFAGFFEGNVTVLGKATVTVLEITGGGDLAEPFLMEDSTTVEPGTVLVIDEHHPGNLKIADSAYDRKVAGIVSGANGIGTGLTLQHASLSGGNTLVALTGRVFCKAEAISSPIQPGDLLTTSSFSGHAMKAVSESSSWGAIIGKAMTGLPEGTGFVLVLVSLQ